MFCEVFVSRKENLLSMKNKLIGKVLALALSLMAAIALTAVTASAQSLNLTGFLPANWEDTEHLTNTFSNLQNQLNNAVVNAPNTVTGTVFQSHRSGQRHHQRRFHGPGSGCRCSG